MYFWIESESQGALANTQIVFSEIMASAATGAPGYDRPVNMYTNLADNATNGWIIPVFVSDAKKGNKIVLHYNGGRAQRVMTTKDNEAIIAIHAASR